MSTQNLSELATRAQAGHLLDAVEGQWLDRPRQTVQNIILQGTARYQELHRQVVELLVAEFGFPAYPKVGEIFELAIDGDAPENQPLALVSEFDKQPTAWHHDGPKIVGKQTRRFKLVQVSHCRGLEEVKEKLKVHGKNPEGQWVKAFETIYPKPDRQGPIGVADPSWISPYGQVHFPYTRTNGGLSSRLAIYDHSTRWRWLVEVK